MSFIDKALERAKELHGKAEPAAEGQKPDSPKPLPVAGSVGYSEPLKDICYTQTRTLPVNHDLLYKNRLIINPELAPIAEEYKHLRTHILLNTKEGALNTLMFTGPRPNEGKSLTAINMAISISQEVDQTVLLVDADLRNPSVNRYFGLPTDKGLIDFLKNGVPIPDLLVHPEGLAKLVILPGGQPAPDAAELIRSPQMVELVQELKHCYPDRYVLFDLPPILSFTDAMAFAPLVDGIIIVVEAGKTPREEIVRCTEMLKKYNVLGVVLNKVVPQGNENYYYYEDQKPPEKKLKLPWGK